ncbi:MAG: response regulator transcription factor [Acidimicrobiia bacterium]
MEADLLRSALEAEPDISVDACCVSADGRTTLRILGQPAATVEVDWDSDSLRDVLVDLRSAARRPVAIQRLDQGGGRKIHALTMREADVLRRVATGATTMEIARSLKIGSAAVEAAKGRAYRKLGVHNRVGAVAESARRPGGRSGGLIW